MSLGDLQRLLLLSAIWGASFILFRVIVPVLGPVVTVELRVLIAGIALLIYAGIIRANLEWRERWPWYAIVGITNSAIPFALITICRGGRETTFCLCSEIHEFLLETMDRVIRGCTAIGWY